MARKKKSNEDENNENLANQSDSDDTFGLPDIEYKPLNREEEVPASPVEEQPREVVVPETPRFETEQKPMEQNTQFTYEPEEEESPVWPKVLGILLVVAVALGAAWYYVVYRPAQEKARVAEEQRL